MRLYFRNYSCSSACTLTCIRWEMKRLKKNIDRLQQAPLKQLENREEKFFIRKIRVSAFPSHVCVITQDDAGLTKSESEELSDDRISFYRRLRLTLARFSEISVVFGKLTRHTSLFHPRSLWLLKLTSP